MPYKLQGNTVTKTDGTVIKRHKTRKAALLHLAALRLNVKEALTVPRNAALLRRMSEHLAGQHNQKRHAGKGGGISNGAKNFIKWILDNDANGKTFSEEKASRLRTELAKIELDSGNERLPHKYGQQFGSRSWASVAFRDKTGLRLGAIEIHWPKYKNGKAKIVIEMDSAEDSAAVISREIARTGNMDFFSNISANNINLTESAAVRPLPHLNEHLAGKHNQKSHGNKYGSVDAIKGNVKRLGKDKEALKRMAARARQSGLQGEAKRERKKALSKSLEDMTRDELLEMRARIDQMLGASGADNQRLAAEQGKPKPDGKKGNVVTAVGTDPTKKYEMRYELRELDELVTSNTADGRINPDYPSELQPRDRTRASSRAQVANIAADLEPDALLDEFKAIDRGTPIFGAYNAV